MSSTPNTARRRLRILSAVLLSAAGLWFGTGLTPYWPLLWLAPIPVLLVVTGESFLTCFGISFVAWMLGGLNEWGYLRDVIPAMSVVLLAIAFPAVVFGVAICLWNWFIRRDERILAALCYASAWTCIEFCLARLSPHATFGSVAHSQMDNLIFLQMASLTGTSGITFLLFFVPALVVAAKLSPMRRKAVLPCLAIVVVFTGSYGVLRLQAITNGVSLPVGLVASDEKLYPQRPDEVQALLLGYAAQARQLTADGVRLVVMPEKCAVLQNPMVADADRVLGDAARQAAYIAIGFERRTSSAKLNEIRIYGPDSKAIATYEKHHMLPAFEANLLPGTARVLLPQTSGNWGFQICKDMDFPELSRQYGADGAGLMIVPAWDFVADGWLHGRMAIMRGVESGFSIVRAAKQGVLSVSDSAGRVKAESTTIASGFVTLQTTVPVQHVDTLYAHWGDWFGWLTIGLLVASLLAAFIGRRRPRVEIREPSQPSALAETKT